MIEFEGVRKRLGGRLVLNGASFRVPPGGVLGLAGGLGSGKTTALRILATVVPLDDGVVSIAGTRVDRDPLAVRRQIGYLPQRKGFYRRLSSQEYLEFYAGVHGVPPRRRRRLAEELLEALGLTDQASSEAADLGAGPQRRLDVARALVHDPPVLVLDEPAATVDDDSRDEILAVIRELAAMGKTMVVSGTGLAHLDFCTFLGLLAEGRTVVVGPADEVHDAVSEGLAAKGTVGTDHGEG